MQFSISAAIVLVISTLSIAAPTALKPRASLAALADGVCDLSKVTVPLVAGLPAPSDGLVLGHVAVGRGTQNYTCDPTNPTAAPKAVGAKATLFNVTCLSTSPQNMVASLPTLAIKMAIPNTVASLNNAITQLTSGHHYFTNLTTPYFDFHSDVSHNYGTVATVKLAAAAAPKDATTGVNGSAAVPWLKLAGIQGDYKEVYRVDTAGGAAPATCQDQKAAFEVDYSAVYYFYKAA